MKILFAHIGPLPHFGSIWTIIILFSLILFVALVVADALKGKDN
jgi:hypothetical protein